MGRLGLGLGLGKMGLGPNPTLSANLGEGLRRALEALHRTLGRAGVVRLMAVLDQAVMLPPLALPLLGTQAAQA